MPFPARTHEAARPRRDGAAPAGGPSNPRLTSAAQQYTPPNCLPRLRQRLVSLAGTPQDCRRARQLHQL